MSLADPSLSGPWLRAGDRVLGPVAAPFVLPLLTARRRQLAALFLLGLIGAGAALVPPWITKLVIDLGLVAGDATALVTWSLVLFAVGLVSLGLGALSSILHMRVSVSMLAELRGGLVGEVLARPPAWRARHQTGELMARIDGDAAEVQQFAFNALLTGSGALVKLVGGAVLLFVLNWKLALLAACLAPLELLFFAYARPRTERLAHESRAARGRFAGQLGEMLAGLPSLQAIGAEPGMAKRLSRAQAALNDRLVAAQLWGEVTRGAPQILSALVRLAVFVAGGLAVIRGDWPLGSLIAFLAYLGFLTGPTQSLIGLWHAHARLKAALTRIGTLVEDDARVDWPADPVALPPPPGGALTFSGVRHANMAAPVTARIPAGGSCLVSGPSGVGKSSLICLLQRLAEPEEGEIRLDGCRLDRLNRTSLRAAITLVPQRPFVFRATLGENLRVTCPGAPKADLLDRLALVGLGGRFGPEALSVTIGESGLTLSGGERQRLCLARALLCPGRVLVLDEALSEVDPETTMRIARAIRQRWPALTLLVTTHRDPGLYGGFDQVIALA